MSASLSRRGKRVFTDGDPLSGNPATILPADWADTIQAELANLLEGSGVDLDASDDSQLLKFIRRVDVPRYGFGDFIPVADSPNNVVASCQGAGSVIFVQDDGKIITVLGHRCVQIVDLNVPLTAGAVRAAHDGTHLRVAHLIGGSCTIYTVPFSTLFEVGAVVTEAIDYRIILGLPGASRSKVFGAAFSPDGALFIAVPAVDADYGAVHLARIKDSSVRSLGNHGDTYAAGQTALNVISDDQLAFVTVDAASVDTYTFHISGDGQPPATHRSVAREPSNSAVGPLLGMVALNRFENLNAWIVIFRDGSTVAFQLIGEICSNPRALPAGWTFLNSFTWGGSFYLTLVRTDFSAISFWRLETGG